MAKHGRGHPKTAVPPSSPTLVSSGEQLVIPTANEGDTTEDSTKKNVTEVDTKTQDEKEDSRKL